MSRARPVYPIEGINGHDDEDEDNPVRVGTSTSSTNTPMVDLATLAHQDNTFCEEGNDTKPRSGHVERPQRNVNLEQYNTVTEVDGRLRELEQEEQLRYVARKAALERRQTIDEALTKKRQAEDERWNQDDLALEAEGTELRRKRKSLRRASLGIAQTVAYEYQNNYLLQPSHGVQQLLSGRRPSPTLNNYISPTKTVLDPSPYPKREYTRTERWENRHNPPDGMGRLGEPVWKRSDGVMVKVVCAVPNCSKGNFKTLHGVQVHSGKRHGIKYRDRNHVLSVCGKVAEMPEGWTPASISVIETAGSFGDPRMQQLDDAHMTQKYTNPLLGNSTDPTASGGSMFATDRTDRHDQREIDGHRVDNDAAPMDNDRNDTSVVIGIEDIQSEVIASANTLAYGGPSPLFDPIRTRSRSQMALSNEDHPVDSIEQLLAKSKDNPKVPERMVPNNIQYPENMGNMVLSGMTPEDERIKRLLGKMQ